MSDWRIKKLLDDGGGFERLLSGLRNHGDLQLAAEHAGVEPAGAAELALYRGSDPVVVEASLAVELAMAVGKRAQDGYARRLFLETLRLRGVVTEAVAAQRWHPRSWFYQQKERHPDFDAAWEEAIEEATDRLRREAWRRGVEGVKKPVVWQGQFSYQEDPETGRVEPLHVLEYSDRMLELLLKRHDPGFKERVDINQKTELRADVGLTGEALARLTDDELGVLLKITGGATHTGADAGTEAERE